MAVIMLFNVINGSATILTKNCVGFRQLSNETRWYVNLYSPQWAAQNSKSQQESCAIAKMTARCALYK